MRPLVWLLLAGCAGARGPETGLSVRLLAREPFALGRSMIVELAATNRGERSVSFDVQGLPHRPFSVAREVDGSPVAFVAESAGGLGTFQDVVSLAPGETRVLERLDVGSDYAILAPGGYVVRFDGLPLWGGAKLGWTHEGEPGSAVVAVPPSAPLRFTVADGPLDARGRLLRELLPKLPEGWIVFKAPDGLTFQRNRVPGSSLHARVSLLLEDGSAPRLLPLTLGGKAGRRPEDDRIEEELRRSEMPRLEALTKRPRHFVNAQARRLRGGRTMLAWGPSSPCSRE